MTFLKRLKYVPQLSRYFGIGWLVFRASYALRIKTGILRRQMPIYRWSDRPLIHWLNENVPSTPLDYVRWRKVQSTRFFFTSLPDNLSGDVAAEAEALLEG